VSTTLPPLPYREVQAIPRASSIGRREFVERFQRPGRPVVLGGLTDGWPARRWTPAALAERFGDAEVGAYVLRQGRIQLDPERGFLIDRMALGAYLAEIEVEGAGARHYLRSGLGALPEAMRREVLVPYLARGGLALRQNVWIAAAGTVSHLHFDLPRNLVSQLHGTKRFILFSPRERWRLDPHPVLSSTPHLSRLDAERPDFSRAPRARDAVAWHAVLEPGDTLFLPPGWWHHARALAPSISVNTWWSPLLLRPLVLVSDAYKALRGLQI
jgi:hypothetical protein